ncbi:hypothetical protein C8R44DRAFT_973183 [Mycena epipterygia]|nr:hypothetical protein C8R44DRAFT_973183 [Mycena epipterygia]
MHPTRSRGWYFLIVSLFLKLGVSDSAVIPMVRESALVGSGIPDTLPPAAASGEGLEEVVSESGAASRAVAAAAAAAAAADQVFTRLQVATDIITRVFVQTMVIDNTKTIEATRTSVELTVETQTQTITSSEFAQTSVPSESDQTIASLELPITIFTANSAAFQPILLSPRLSLPNRMIPPPHSSNHAAVVIGALIGVATIMLGISLSLYIVLRRRKLSLRRRRASLQTIFSSQDQAESPEKIDIPSDSQSLDLKRASWEPYIAKPQPAQHPSAPSNTISIRQLYISNQVNRARTHVAKLEDLRSEFPAPPAGGSTSAEGAEPTTNPKNPVSLVLVGDSEDKLEREMEALNSRIHKLENERNSSRALGESDEPPPRYTT